MATIHVNTDVMRQLGNRFIAWNDVLNNQMGPELRSLTSHLENDWQGVSRQHYDQTLQSWEQNIAGMLDSGDDLGRHLFNTANRFDQADNS